MEIAVAEPVSGHSEEEMVAAVSVRAYSEVEIDVASPVRGTQFFRHPQAH
jgi:hypothetical protein